MTGKELLEALSALTPEQLELDVIQENVADGMPCPFGVTGIRVAMTEPESIMAGWRTSDFVKPRLEICND